ncbi:MAG: DUF4258 domain-containing protein [Phycisphaerae bacterium]|nr:DUF4258 domain-containing protein [Phycisphaerae bacterium]
MYEGWYIQFTAHAKRRIQERLVEDEDVREVIDAPDFVEADLVYGGKILTKYLADWDRILVVAIEELSQESVLLVKTVLWSKAN